MLARNDKLIDLVWSPTNDDEFIAYGNDLCLFKVKNHQSNDKSIKLSDELYAEFVANYGENSNPKQVSWYFGNDNPNLYAVSLSNYKIQLVSYNPNSSKKNSQKHFEIQKEFSFKQVRQCTHLVWNSNQKNILAGGFEKVRNEHSVLVWDVRGTSLTPVNRFDLNTESVINCLNYTQSRLPNFTASFSTLNMGSNSMGVDYRQETFRPVYETGNTDTCNSLAWNPANENQLLAGVNGKYLKMFDIRSSTKVGLSVSSKYVSGFTIDTTNPCQAASYLENVAVIWDIRMFNVPLHKIEEVEPISKIQWCPIKSGQLALLSKSSVNIYTIPNNQNPLDSSVIDEDKTPKAILDKITLYPVRTDQQIQSKNNNSNPSLQTQISQTQNVLTNFCWFNFDLNKLLVANNYLVSNLKTLFLFDKIALTWAPNGDFYWSSNLGKMNLIQSLDKNEFVYLKELKERTKFDYGLKYFILNINNGSATMAQSVNNGMSNTSAGGCSATPLAVFLHSQIGLTHLIRSDFAANCKICDTNVTEFTNNLKFLWFWFENVNNFFEKTIPLIPKNTTIEISHNCRNSLSELYSTRYCGLRILLNDLETVVKKCESSELIDIQAERFRVISYYICGWDMKEGTVSAKFFANLKKVNEFERACCLAILTQNYDQALEILDSASQNDSRYGSLWIALRYFIDDQKIGETFRRESSDQGSSCSLEESISSNSSYSSHPTPKKTTHFSLNSSDSPNTTKTTKSTNHSLNESFMKECSKLIDNFTHPYLKALFNYLINKEKSINEILFDRNIKFHDRIVLSIHFMFDLKNLSNLQVYFDKLIDEECLKNSDLSGILLTGLGSRSIDLFQSFIDRTGDLQTVCLAIIHSPYLDVLESNQVVYWINSYREQLNKFKLWEKRAEFDLLRMKLKKLQTLTNSPDYVKPVPIESCVSEPSLPSSSSSSSSLSSHIMPSTKNPTVLVPSLKNVSNSCNQIHPPAQQQHHNQLINRFQQQNKLNQRIINSQSMNLQISLNTPNSSQANSLMNVYLNCNKCGKNIMEKSTASSSYFSTNIFGLSFQSSNSQTNEICLTGCLNCSFYLPQCVVCLRLMKVNLIPNPLNNLSNQINRVQTTPKIYQSNHFKKMSVQYKSPSQIEQVRNPSLNFYLNENETSKRDSHEYLEVSENGVELTKIEMLYANNFNLLKNTKFGNWFSWCQMCHHGGHIKHLIYWFKTNKKCPYLHCKCSCTELDCLF